MKIINDTYSIRCKKMRCPNCGVLQIGYDENKLLYVCDKCHKVFYSENKKHKCKIYAILNSNANLVTVFKSKKKAKQFVAEAIELYQSEFHIICKLLH